MVDAMSIPISAWQNRRGCCAPVLRTRCIDAIQKHPVFVGLLVSIGVSIFFSIISTLKPKP